MFFQRACQIVKQLNQRNIKPYGRISFVKDGWEKGCCFYVVWPSRTMNGN